MQSSKTNEIIYKRLDDKIFNHLYTAKSKGIGLGLASVKKIIVDQHNGCIKAKNTINGVMFTIYLHSTNEIDEKPKNIVFELSKTLDPSNLNYNNSLRHQIIYRVDKIII